jgi:hypothetical protein
MATGRHHGAISLMCRAVSGGFARDRLLWPDKGRFGRVSHLLQSRAAFGIALPVAGASIAANLSDAGVAQW